MPLWFRVARVWLPVAVVVTVLTGLVYVAVQQSYRNGLDDPQVQLAQDGAARLDAGASPASVVNSPTVDAEKSLAPFVIVFGAKDEALAAGVRLRESTPTPPAGVLASARSGGHSRVTWQPRAGVRIASVSFSASDGRVVVAGRNMREVESRVDDLTLIAALAWAAALLGGFAMVLLVEFFGLRLQRRAESHDSD